MECKNLYRVQEKDLDRLREILTICFKNDPLYSALIEDQETRERLMPHLFSCDVTECFETCEVISVILQVTYFKKTGGKRLFKMAPIHHHFELCGWSETRVVAVFSIITAILCLIALMGV